MATFQEIMDAAVKLNNAGNTEGAKLLVLEAKRLKDSAQAPQGNPVAPEAQAAPKKQGYFGDTAVDMASGPLENAGMFAKGITNPAESGLYAAMPENWNPGLKATYASIGNAGLAGLSAVEAGVAGIAGLGGDVIGLMGASENSQSQFARDAMGMLEASAGSAPVANPSGIMAGKTAAAAIRADRKLSNVATAARDLKITPALGMKGKTAAMVAAGLEKIPVAGDVIAKDATRAVGEIEGALAKITGGAGRSTFEAGSKLQSGVMKFITDFTNRSDVLYGEVGKYIKPESRYNISATAEALDKLKQPFKDSEELAKKLKINEWDKVISEAGKTGLSWDAMKQFRSDVGAAIGDTRGALGDESSARLKLLYANLTKDMTAAAAANGAPALNAWTRANRFYAAGAKRIERNLDSLVKPDNKGVPTIAAERAYELFSATTKEGRSTADIVRLRKIKKSMPESDWQAISTTIAERMGRAKSSAQNAEGDVFSPATFLTEWDKISPEARATLFDEGTRIELTKLARVTKAFKDGSIERNMSNTATAENLAKIAIGLTIAPVTTATTVGSATVAAKLLTSKAMTDRFFLRAVNDAIAGKVRPLEAMARGRGEIADDAKVLMQMLAVEAQGGDAANSTNPPRAAISR